MLPPCLEFGDERQRVKGSPLADALYPSILLTILGVEDKGNSSARGRSLSTGISACCRTGAAITRIRSGQEDYARGIRRHLWPYPCLLYTSDAAEKRIV